MSIEQLHQKYWMPHDFRKEAAKALSIILDKPESQQAVIALPPSGLMGGVLVQRMFVPADRAIALGIYCRYCILRRQILTELVLGGHHARQTGGTPDPASQELAGLR